MSRVVAWLLLAVAAASPGHAPAQTASEEQVKAAYLFRFLSFVEWPARAFAAPDTPLVVGILGGEEIHDEFAALAAGRKAQGRPIAARRLLERDSLAGVHLLFVARRYDARLAQIAAGAVPWTLVVSESENGPPDAATINFVSVEGRIRFEINLARAARGDLRISPRMIAVAQKVTPVR